MGFSFLAIIFVFGLLVLIHELGHFLAAKWMGVRVERFSIGFPPRLFGKKVGDTDYCVSAIPLGGYVKMSGMIDESMDTEATGADYEFNSKPVWKRLVIIVAGVVMNFFLAVLILSVLNFTKGEKITPYTEIGIIGKEGISKKIGFEIGDKILSVNNVPVSSWEGFQKEYLNNLNQDITFSVKRDSEILDLVYKKEWFSEKNAEFLDIWYRPEARVGNVHGNTPAMALGLQKGDLILRLNDQPVADWYEMTKVIRSHPEKEIRIDWSRDGRTMSGYITPAKYQEKDSLENDIMVGKIGVEQYYEHYSISLPRAVINGFRDTFGLIMLNIRGVWWVISQTKSVEEVLGGPIMIAKMAGDAAAAGWEPLWTLIAALSAILAFMNILPIPALDGGHLLLLIIEGITRKPISTRTRVIVQQVGMAILLTLIVFILYVDIRRLIVG